MSETNQLVVIEKAKSREVFQTPGAIQAILEEVKAKALLMNAEFDRKREAAERAVLEAKLAQERAEREKAEAEARAVREKQEAEEVKAAADKKHRAIVNSSIVSALMSECGFSEGDAKKIVIAAAKGKLGKLIIDY